MKTCLSVTARLEGLLTARPCDRAWGGELRENTTRHPGWSRSLSLSSTLSQRCWGPSAGEPGTPCEDRLWLRIFAVVSLRSLLQTGLTVPAWHLPAKGQEAARLPPGPSRGHVSLTCRGFWPVSILNTRKAAFQLRDGGAVAGFYHSPLLAQA